MGSFVSYWSVACEVIFVLSIGCLLGLIGGWNIVPESSERGITEPGRRLLRARQLFAILCAMVIAFLGILIYLEFAPYDSEPFRWCDSHRFIVPICLLISSGLSAASFFHTLIAKGQGRRVLLGGTAVIFVLLFLSALYLTQGLSH